MKIKFSHHYLKMGITFPKDAILREVFKVKLEDLHRDFIERDTIFFDNGRLGFYPLPKKGNYMVLLFEQYPLVFKGSEGGMPMWTTIRKYTPAKYKYYLENRGKLFEIELDPQK